MLERSTTYHVLLICCITFVLLGLFASNAPLYFASSDNPYLSQITMVEIIEEEASFSKLISRTSSGSNRVTWIEEQDVLSHYGIGDPVSAGLLRPLFHPEKITPPPR